MTTTEINTPLSPSIAPIPSSQSKQYVCPTLSDNGSPTMLSSHGVEQSVNVAATRPSVSILQAPHSSVVPKSMPNNARNQPYHVGASKPQSALPLGNNDSSSSSEYSSSPPSPRSDNVFLNNVPDVKTTSELQEGMCDIITFFFIGNHN